MSFEDNIPQHRDYLNKQIVTLEKKISQLRRGHLSDYEHEIEEHQIAIEELEDKAEDALTQDPEYIKLAEDIQTNQIEIERINKYAKSVK